MKVKTTQYDAFAKEFAAADMEVAPFDKTRDMLRNLLSLNSFFCQNVLDLGCGYGGDLSYLQKRAGSVYGVDESKEMIALAKNSHRDAKLFRADFANLPFVNSMFDVAYSRYAIQHAQKIEPIFKELYRVMKNDGQLVFLVTHPMRQYFESAKLKIQRPRRNYWQQFDCKSEILNGQVTVTEPTHTLQEYMTPAILSRFRLEKVVEGVDIHSDINAHLREGQYPDVLLMSMRKMSDKKPHYTTVID